MEVMTLSLKNEDEDEEEEDEDDWLTDLNSGAESAVVEDMSMRVVSIPTVDRGAAAVQERLRVMAR